MRKSLKCIFRTMPVSSVTCLLLCTGCSSVEATAANLGLRTSQVTDIEQDKVKPENPRVHPGESFNEGWWPDP